MNFDSQASSNYQYKWIATAYDSDCGFALGETPEEAMINYRDSYGEPAYGVGFSVIRNRDDYKKELARVGIMMGYPVEKSIPLNLASDWIIVARITPEAVVSLEGKDRASKLQNDWSRDDGEFFIDAPEEVKLLPYEYTSRAQRREKKADIQPIDGIEPSDRQKEWAKEYPYDWLNRMAWAHDKGELELTQSEITYAQTRYGKSAFTVVVPSVYRVLRDARSQHTPEAGPELVKRAIDAGYTQAELSRRCGVSREHLRLLAAGDRDISFGLQVLLEDLALAKRVVAK